MRTYRRRPSIRGPASIVLAVATLAAVSSCGGDGDPSATTTTSTTAAPSETTASASPSDEPSETESESEEPTEVETTPEDGADVEIVVTIVGDSVTTPADRVVVELGQTVRITVTSDADDELHVHGFELEVPLVAGTPAVLEFEVGATPGPGLYEVETHESGLLLLQLEVR